MKYSKTNVVVVGGGSGLSVLLRGLKQVTNNITAIVTVSDDGGGSGDLREDLGMLPPGDIRNCILALSNTEPLMERLLQYRFSEGKLKGQNFGNLLIAAMVGISDNFEQAVKRVNDIFAVTGKVLPVSSEEIDLYARLKNGNIVEGESQIPKQVLKQDSAIERIFLKPSNPKPLRESLEAINHADIIILGPGSLYTSVIPNLLLNEITLTIKDSTAPKVYISNLMTQPGETDHCNVIDHIKALLDHTEEGFIDYVVANNGDVPERIIEKYQSQGSDFIKLSDSEREEIKNLGIKILEDDYTEVVKDYCRHDALKISEDILGLVETKIYEK